MTQTDPSRNSSARTALGQKHGSASSDDSRACHSFLQARRVNRRAALAAGGVGMLGLGLDALGIARAAGLTTSKSDRPAGFGKAKSCIFLFMWGGPSHLDTFDPKPDAPREIRGPFKTIETAVPGLRFSEHFKGAAKLADRFALVRSLHHDDPAHLSSGHATLTGHRAPAPNSDAEPPSDRDTPHLGSVVSRLRASGELQAKALLSGATPLVPSFVTLPWLAYHPAAPGGKAPGQHGGWLGSRYDPMLLTGDPNLPDWRVAELSLPDTISQQRLDSRQSLLRNVDDQRRLLDAAAAGAATGFKQQAFDLLSSGAARQAFDLSAEPDAVRDRYGRNIHGQCLLLARRLVENGVGLVSVNWHNDGRNFWDTHGNNFNRLKNDLIPPADQALCALLTDLEERGLLDETIVAWVGEFGRKPKINGQGREHWPYCYSGLLAGGGVRGGAIYGSSDKHGEHPAELPCTPQDYAATIYHALGVDPAMTLPDRFGRPLAICEGEPLQGLFG
jgi:hypothetical protein